MTELNKVVGALLRDIAHSRVISDIFSRDVSVEYEKDELLRHFPVPRVEIREITINLAFAVKEIKPEEISELVIINIAKTSTQKILDGIIKGYEDRDDLQELIRAKSPLLSKKIENTLVRLSKESKAEIELTLHNKKRSVLAAKIGDALFRSILEDKEIQKALKGALTRRLRARIYQLATEFESDLITEIREKAEKSFSLDVAVTRDELIDLPEAAISKMTLVAELQNYIWTEIEEADGKTVKRLIER